MYFPDTMNYVESNEKYIRWERGSKGGQKWCQNAVKMPIFYNNVLHTPYNGTKPGLMGNISFQTRNRKMYLKILCNRYGSTGPKWSFWVLNSVKMPIFCNNIYKTPYYGIKPGEKYRSRHFDHF